MVRLLFPYVPQVAASEMDFKWTVSHDKAANVNNRRLARASRPATETIVRDTVCLVTRRI